MSALTPERKIDIYRLLRLNRSVEERLVHLYRQGKIVGGLHRSLGQEATSVGIAENNGWAYSTPFRKQTAARSLADRGVGYGIPAETIDGNDVEAVYEASRRAVERARAGRGPTLLEAKTYRMKGHAEHDGQGY